MPIPFWLSNGSGVASMAKQPSLVKGGGVEQAVLIWWMAARRAWQPSWFKEPTVLVEHELTSLLALVLEVRGHRVVEVLPGIVRAVGWVH